jgi:hypothetical protein
MTNIHELFWNASINEMIQGYIYQEKSTQYVCIICGESFTDGVIYPMDDVLLEANKAVKAHISNKHGSIFEYLLNMDRRFTGLTELQKRLLGLFYRGYSDSDIVAKVDGGSTSTIRNHRFALRQREKQAKVFLSLMEILEKSKSAKKQEYINIPRRVNMIDEKFNITEEESQKVINAYFKEGPDGPLSEFPTKEKKKIIVLNHLLSRFNSEKQYTEKEVNEILKPVFLDHMLLRRSLVDYGFMDRLRDGSLYWVKN